MLKYKCNIIVLVLDQKSHFCRGSASFPTTLQLYASICGTRPADHSACTCWGPRHCGPSGWPPGRPLCLRPRVHSHHPAMPPAPRWNMWRRSNWRKTHLSNFIKYLKNYFIQIHLPSTFYIMLCTHMCVINAIDGLSIQTVTLIWHFKKNLLSKTQEVMGIHPYLIMAAACLPPVPRRAASWFPRAWKYLSAPIVLARLMSLVTW